MKLDFTFDSTESDAGVSLFNALKDFNRAHVKETSPRGFTITATDGHSQLRGGAVGWLGLGVMHVDVLFVRDDSRGTGLGSSIMERVETEAKSAGCRYVQLDTFSFQAPAFYARRGYERFATLPLDNGAEWAFMVKRLID